MSPMWLPDGSIVGANRSNLGSGNIPRIQWCWRTRHPASTASFLPRLQLDDRKQSGSGECLISSHAHSSAVQRNGRNSTEELRQNRRRKPAATTYRFGLISIQEPKIHGSKQSVKDLGPCFGRSGILADHSERRLQFFAGWVAAEAFSPGFSNTVLGGVRRVIR